MEINELHQIIRKIIIEYGEKWLIRNILVDRHISTHEATQYIKKMSLKYHIIINSIKINRTHTGENEITIQYTGIGEDLLDFKNSLSELCSDD